MERRPQEEALQTMAKLFPVLASVTRRMTSGERRFASRLETHLEDDYLCWYDVPVGRSGTHPDFIILHPRRGILILEVKDWKLSSIHAFGKTSVTLITEKGLKHTANPLEQARQYAQAVKDVLERDKALVHPEGSPYQGRLVLPWAHGVVFTNITRAQLEAAGQGEDIGQVLPLERVMCQDDMLESTGAEALQSKLWGMFSRPFACLLTMPQIDRIRWHLFPEIRITQRPLELESDEHLRTAEVPDVVRVMDLQQEQLARSLVEGHRVIHGVAGSGKTMILGYRCQYLAKVLAKPILVLCFNVALAERLQHLVARQGLAEKVAARNFHKWCRDQLRLYHVPEPQAEGQAYYPALVEAVEKAVERGQIPRAQYGAVLIDEAHDFEAAWLRLVAQMVDPETSSLLVLYDDAQNLYGAARRRKFSFAEVGIQARGRTTILRLNYRNTAEVLGVAYEFAREVLSPEEAEEDGIPVLSPESAGRHGELPSLVTLPSLEAEADYFVATARKLHAGGMAWGDMAVLYRNRFIAERFSERLDKAGIPRDWPGEGKRRKFRPDRDSVKLLTMHASKGLEFPLVVIPGLGYMPHAKEDPGAEARLLYVAMTRAIDRLVLTGHRGSAFVERLGEAIARVSGILPGAAR
jgi:hypothetical protein